MTRTTATSLAYITTVAAAAIAASLVSTSAYAESPTIDSTPFVSTKTRAEVQAELKTPYVGGNPWSTQYNFARSSDLTTQQVRSTYKMSRDEVHALTSEDSGSAYLAATPLKVKTSTSTMGGPGLDPSNQEAE